MLGFNGLGCLFSKLLGFRIFLKALTSKCFHVRFDDDHHGYIS